MHLRTRAFWSWLEPAGLERAALPRSEWRSQSERWVDLTRSHLASRRVGCRLSHASRSFIVPTLKGSKGRDARLRGLPQERPERVPKRHSIASAPRIAIARSNMCRGHRDVAFRAPANVAARPARNSVQSGELVLTEPANPASHVCDFRGRSRGDVEVALPIVAGELEGVRGRAAHERQRRHSGGLRDPRKGP